MVHACQVLAYLPSHIFDYEVRPKVGYAGKYYYYSYISFLATTARESGPIK